ncbi:hypothetical protein [Desulfopila aestuarii]|nr:hypothetical protein [Desulfopila aestuarii]
MEEGGKVLQMVGVAMAARGKCASRVVAGCIILLFLATTAHGDGTGRKPTPAEQEFYRSTQDALAAALPADVPEGWEITDQAESDELEVVGIETGTRPMEVTYYLQWTNVALQEQGEEKAADQISAITGSSPVSDEDVAEYERLAVKVAEAAAAGDIETVRVLRQQMAEQAAVFNKAFGEVDEKIVEINRAITAPDSHVAMYLFANRLSQSLEPGAVRTVVAGYPAFRAKGYYTPSGEWHEETTTVFMGKGWFATPGDAAYQVSVVAKAPHTSLQTVVAVIEADPRRTGSIVEMIDWPALQAALDQN